MRLSRLITGLLVLLIVGSLLWRRLPALRRKARAAYQRHGGWTEEARRDDPVGFLEHAEQVLADDLSRMTDTRRNLDLAQTGMAAELAKQQGLHAASVELATRFRTAYREAGAADAFPVKVAGTPYSEQDLVEQVRLVLLQQTNYSEIITELERAAVAATEHRQELLGQTSATKAALASLPARLEIARAKQLTEKTSALIREVNSLLDRNETVLSDSPVRTVEELIGPGSGPGSDRGAVDVREFLETTAP